MKDVAGNTKCFSKTLYVVNYFYAESQTCKIQDVWASDWGEVIYMAIDAECTSKTDTDRAWANFHTLGSNYSVYTIEKIRKNVGSTSDLGYYRDFNIWNQNGTSSIKTSTGTYTSYQQGALTWTFGYNQNATCNIYVNKIVADGTTTIYDAGFKAY